MVTHCSEAGNPSYASDDNMLKSIVDKQESENTIQLYSFKPNTSSDEEKTDFHGSICLQVDASEWSGSRSLWPAHWICDAQKQNFFKWLLFLSASDSPRFVQRNAQKGSFNLSCPS